MLRMEGLLIPLQLPFGSMNGSRIDRLCSMDNIPATACFPVNLNQGSSHWFNSNKPQNSPAGVRVIEYNC